MSLGRKKKDSVPCSQKTDLSFLFTFNPSDLGLNRRVEISDNDTDPVSAFEIKRRKIEMAEETKDSRDVLDNAKISDELASYPVTLKPCDLGWNRRIGIADIEELGTEPVSAFERKLYWEMAVETTDSSAGLDNAKVSGDFFPW